MEDLLNFGLINIDKSKGPTSYSVSEFVKRKLGLNKTSHMGTLDPKVTGVLPITLGRACKLAGYFIKHDKSYVGILHTHKEQSIEELQELIEDNFVGRIKQTPPHRSAVKVQERERTVYSWNLLEADETNRNFLFEARVEGGTYLRKLCSDLGEMIGGAHMEDLRRSAAGIFDESTIVRLEDFETAVDEYAAGDDSKLRAMIVPAEDAIKRVLPVVEIDKSAMKALRVGKPLLKTNVKGDVKIGKDECFVAFCGKKFVGVYKKTNEKGIFARPEFVKD